MTRSRILLAASAVLAFILGSAGVVSTESGRALARASSGAGKPAIIRRYGATIPLGVGHARAYVTVDGVSGVTLELGVAIGERALDGLPTSGSGHHDGGLMTREYILDVPAGYRTPFRFVELNWNPAGHEPEGVYQACRTSTSISTGSRRPSATRSCRSIPGSPSARTTSRPANSCRPT